MDRRWVYRTDGAMSPGHIVGKGWEGFDGPTYKVQLDDGLCKEAVPEEDLSAKGSGGGGKGGGKGKGKGDGKGKGEGKGKGGGRGKGDGGGRGAGRAAGRGQSGY